MFFIMSTLLLSSLVQAALLASSLTFAWVSVLSTCDLQYTYAVTWGSASKGGGLELITSSIT